VRARARRSGPPDEAAWWDPADQAWAEAFPLRRRNFGRGWLDATMPNNVERRDHLGPGEASARVSEARDARAATALDEGRAWRRRNDSVLAVLRVEVFASGDESAHRLAWQADGAAALDETWRARWRERDVEPGWVEATFRPPIDRPDPRIDWVQIEDHTGAAEADAVTAYQYVVAWLGRAQATLTIRHRLGLDLDPTVRAAVAAMLTATR